MAEDSDNSLHQERLAHAQALQVLGEVRDYLMRLPLVPATREQARRIDEFLASPQAAVARRRVEDQRRADETWTGGCFTPAGYPALIVEVRGDSLLIAGKVLKALTARTAVVGSTRDVVPALQLELRKSTNDIELLPPDA